MAGLALAGGAALALAVAALVAGGTDGPGRSAAGALRLTREAPGVGRRAPPLRLGRLGGRAGARSQMFDLGARRDGRVLLYFREGVFCQPCWAQQRLLAEPGARRRLRVDEVLAITTDPLRPARESALREDAPIPLSDPSTRVSASYGALPWARRSGAAGHTFVVVGGDGRIVARADYVADGSLERSVPLARLARDLRASARRR